MPPINPNSGRYFLGVDPGASGGVALVTEGRVVWAFVMPESDEPEDALLHYALKMMGSEYESPANHYMPSHAIVERVSGWIGGRKEKTKAGEDMKHGGAPGSAMFSFGRNYGGCRMLLATLKYVYGVEYSDVPPATWQRALGVPARVKGEKPHQHKAVLKAMAQHLFPATHITLKTCDAILLAEYCRRTYG